MGKVAKKQKTKKSHCNREHQPSLDHVGVNRENNRKNHVAWKLDILVEIPKFHQNLFCLSFPGTRVNSISLPAHLHLIGAKWLSLANGMGTEVMYTAFRPGP